jgi:hypothetical protein
VANENKKATKPVDRVENESPVDPDDEPVDPVEHEAPVDNKPVDPVEHEASVDHNENDTNPVENEAPVDHGDTGNDAKDEDGYETANNDNRAGSNFQNS